MYIWLIKAAEQKPGEGRTGSLAEYLSLHGHRVVQWGSSFDHGTKKHIEERTKRIRVNKNYDLILLHSRIIYHKNVSISRILYIEELAHIFEKVSVRIDKPDLILCSWPTALVTASAEKYAKKYNIPIIIDIRDLWPDIFYRAIPYKYQKIVAPILEILKLQSSSIIKKADGLTAVTDAALEWGLKKSSRSATNNDRRVFIGRKQKEYSKVELGALLKEWDKIGISDKTWNICFYGSFSYDLDLNTAIKAFNLFNKKHENVKFIICGDGDNAPALKEIAKGNSNIVFPGWCDDNQIRSLLSISKVGLYPIQNLFDLRDTFSNKIVGYMAEGVPVISSLEGFSASYIKEYKIGRVYQEGDANSLLDCYEYLFNHPAVREELGNNAMNRFLCDFESNIVNKQFEDEFVSVLNNYRKEHKDVFRKKNINISTSHR